jgi:tetratricopeptide (TPR) repeat protein
VGEPVKVAHWGSMVLLWFGCPVLASRYAHWRLTRSLSLTWAFCARAARSPLIETAVVLVVLWQGPSIYRQATGHTISWVVVAVLLALAGFVTLLARSRRRTVFQDFPDCTTPDASGVVPGLSAYLANEVDRLGSLYRQVQRERQVAKGEEHIDDPIQPAVELDDTAEFLKGAVSPDAKLSFGPVSIPLGSILGLVARLMKGPQITGSLHREGNQLILLAHYEGALPKSWRVQGSPDSGATDDKGRWNLYPLVEEMAQRMLADLTLGGAVKFRAVAAFSRAAHASLEDGSLARPPLLRQLEVRSCLLEAISEDDSFDLAWYNLGVVLLALDDKEMARSVFMRARSGNPDRWEATYALATLPGPSATRMLLCDQLLSTRPGPGAEARAYDLLGQLCGEQSTALRGSDEAKELSKRAVSNRRLASRRAWRALRQTQWSVRNDKESPRLETARRLASTCLTNLALCYKDDADLPTVAQELARVRGRADGLDTRARLVREKSWQNGQRLPSFRPLLLGGSAADWSKRRRAHRELRRKKGAMRRVRRPALQVELLLTEAGKLGRLDPRTHQELGALNVELHDWKRAANQYSRALRVRIDDPDAWVSLAYAAAKTKHKQLLASQAAQALLTLAPLVQPSQLKLMADTVKGFDPELGERLKHLAALDGWIGQTIAGAKRHDKQALTQLEELTRETRSLLGAAWPYYRCASARCRFEPAPQTGTPNDIIVEELLRATQRLDTECAPAVRRKNIHYSVAKALAGRGQVAAALDHAEKATQTAPFSPWAWRLLGDLHRGRTEFDEAERCYLTGLRWAAQRDQLLALTVSLASCRVDRLQDQSAVQLPNDSLLDARDRLENVLPLLKSAALWHRAKVHYWLGLIAFALADNQQAIAHFTAAAQPTGPDGQWKSGVVSLLALYQLANALVKAGRLDEAQVAFNKVADAITALGPDEDHLRSTPNVGLGRPPTFGEVLVDARLGSAATLAVQGADPAEAIQLIELARQLLSSLPEAARIRCTSKLEALLVRFKTVESRDPPVVEQPTPLDQPARDGAGRFPV